MATATTAKFKRVTGSGNSENRAERAAKTVTIESEEPKLTAEQLSKLGELTPETTIGWVDIDAVFPMGGEENILDNRDGRDRGQPRKHFDPEKLKELAELIKLYGQQQPCVVRRVPSRHEGRKWEYGLISGERRWHSMKFLLNEKKILVRVQDLDKRRSFRQAMIDDLASEKFTPGERASGLTRVFAELEEELGEYVTGAGLEDFDKAWKQPQYDRLLAQWKNDVPAHIKTIIERAIKTQRVPKVVWEDVADVYGLGERSIYRYVTISRLPKKMVQAINEGKMSAKHAEPLVSLKNEIDRNALFKQILRDNLSVAETQEIAKRMLGKIGPQRTESLSTHMKSIVSRFEKAANAPLPEKKEERDELRETARSMREFAAQIEARLAE